MKEVIAEWSAHAPLFLVFGVIAIALGAIGKGADMLVEEAVTLSRRLKISPVLIGATVVSLGTTLPEVTVSVASALDGFPGMALGNAVGSIICDTGLILGLVAVMGGGVIDKRLINRQGFVQLGSAVLLILVCLPYMNLGGVFQEGGRMPQVAGFVFLALLVLYLALSAKWAKGAPPPEDLEAEPIGGSTVWSVVKVLIGIAVVILSSEVLIPSVESAATRMGIPEEVIAGTLVAFGTSLPELVTALTAVRKGHGGLAVGNAIGADILNALFVAGASAAVTKEGLVAGPKFFTVLFPAMIGLLLVFRIGATVGGDKLPRWTGVLLLSGYVAYLFLSY